MSDKEQPFKVSEDERNKVKEIIAGLAFICEISDTGQLVHHAFNQLERLRASVDAPEGGEEAMVSIAELRASIQFQNRSITQYRALLAELIACASPHDPHKNRSNAGRRVTINAPRELVERVRASIGTTPAPQSKDGGEVAISFTRDEAAFVLNELHSGGHGHGSSKDDYEPECPSCTAADKLKAGLAAGVPPSKGPSIDRQTVNRLAAEAGWQNSAVRQADLDALERFARLVLAHGVAAVDGSKP